MPNLLLFQIVLIKSNVIFNGVIKMGGTLESAYREEHNMLKCRGGNKIEII